MDLNVGTKGLDAYLTAAGESDRAPLYRGLQSLNRAIRGSEEPDHDGTSAVTLLAGRMLRAGVVRPVVDHVLIRLAEVADRTQLLQTVVGILDGRTLYFNVAGTPSYSELAGFQPIPDGAVQDPEESILWSLGVFQDNLEMVLARLAGLTPGEPDPGAG